MGVTDGEVQAEDMNVPAQFDEHRAVLRATRDALEGRIPVLARELIRCLEQGGKILLCGNGGSAADAQHLAAEFGGRFLRERRPLPAFDLGTNLSFVTAVANDMDFCFVFSRAVEAHGQAGDVLLCLSTSGNSPNVVEAARTARERGLTVVGFTGAGGGALADACHHLLDVPSASTPRIQEMHMLLGHLVCDLVERAFSEPAGTDDRPSDPPSGVNP